MRKEFSEKEKKILRKIKKIILNTAKKYNINVDKIILFGSRARKNYTKESDWDILIVTKEKLDKRKEEKFWMEIDRKLVENDIIPEILIVDRETLEKYKKHTGFVYYHALAEGKVL